MSLSASKMFTVLQKLFIPVTQFTAFVPAFKVGSGTIGTNMEIGIDVNTDSAVIEGAAGVTAARTLVNSAAFNISAGVRGSAGQLEEISTFGIVGLLMDTAGDDVRHFMEIPQDWDRQQKIRVRVIYLTESGTSADDITWKFMYNAVTPGTDAMATPATVLDTVIAKHSVKGTTRTVERTLAGVIDANKLAAADLYWTFLVEMDAFAGGLSEKKILLGVEFEYTLRAGIGHAVGEARAWRA